MDYIQLSCTLPEYEETLIEIIMARLGELGFESFEQTGDGLLAYIPAAAFDTSILSDPMLWPGDGDIKYSWKVIPEQNWNAVWESNFEPVTIGGRCHIRAPFHPATEGFEHEIVIEPKMSFGTAHHETTALMIETLLEVMPGPKRVLDMGCGTGVLAILASMRGAEKVTAIDNDEWAYKNTLENILKNNTPGINVYHGDAGLLRGMTFDLIIANINRNILLADMQAYAACLVPGSMLLMSGFYRDDLDAVTEKAAKLGLTYKSMRVKNNWVAAAYTMD